MAEANRPDGLWVVSLGHAVRDLPGGCPPPRWWDPSLGMISCSKTTDHRWKTAPAPSDRRSRDAGQRFVRTHVRRTDSAWLQWSSTFNTRGARLLPDLRTRAPEPGGRPGTWSLIVRWDVALASTGAPPLHSDVAARLADPTLSGARGSCSRRACVARLRVRDPRRSRTSDRHRRPPARRLPGDRAFDDSSAENEERNRSSDRDAILRTLRKRGLRAKATFAA
jgi:hypothetical protein